MRTVFHGVRFMTSRDTTCNGSFYWFELNRRISYLLIVHNARINALANERRGARVLEYIMLMRDALGRNKTNVVIV
jgi:hypothetical protein